LNPGDRALATLQQPALAFASRFMGHALPWRGTAQDGMVGTPTDSKVMGDITINSCGYIQQKNGI